MIIRIARKECLEMLRDGRFRWAAGLVAALLLVALLLGAQHYRAVKRQHELAQAETRQQWLKQPAKNPHSAAHYGIYAFKPKLLPALFDRGVDDYTGQAVWLEAHKQNDFKYRPAADATAVQRFGELTAATVMQLLMPLLIILLAFSAFAGEREQGTLRQLLSLGVAKSALAWGKAAGIAAALGVLLIPATLLGVLALALSAETTLLGASFSRMAWMFVSYLLYFGIFIAVSLAVSARAASARLALVALLAFWILNGLIAPRAVADLAKRIHPTPSAFAFQQAIDSEMQGGVDGHDSADQRARELQQRTLKQYNVTKVEALPINFTGIALQASEEHGNEVFDRQYGQLWQAFGRQDRFKQAAGLVAPMLALGSLSRGLAGTDFAQHQDFAFAAEQYRRQFIKVMNDYVTANQTQPGAMLIAQPALWSKVEAFDYEAPPTGWVLRNQSLSLTVLAFWFVAAGALALVATGKMKVD
jgi:ABC-2 type transport system permease protein